MASRSNNQSAARSGIGSGSSAADDSEENQYTNPKYPLWVHVTRYTSVSESGRGGNARFKCHFCDGDFPGSYSRVRAHLLKTTGSGVKICSKVPYSVHEQLCKEDREANAAIVNSAPKNQLVKLPPYENSSSAPSTKKRKAKQTNIADSFTAEERHIADSHIARMFFTGALPFNLARNPEYLASYSYVANTKLGGYVPPSYDALRTTLLQKEKLHVEHMLEPIKATWPFKGVSIATDGWSDPQRRPILNFIAMTEGGPMFLKAINTEGEVKSKEYIFDRLKEVIEEVGSKNVVQVITDNASNCKSAGLKIEGHYKNIFWTPCVVHTLNLAMKDICDPKNSVGDNAELTWIKEAGEDAFYIKNYIMNHGMRLSMFNVFSKLKFLAIAETRFASLHIMLKRLMLIKSSLEKMVLSDEWNNYKEDDLEKAATVKQMILNEVWWGKIKFILSFTEPIYSMIRAADTDKSCLHLIYEMWDTMIEKVKVAIYRGERKEHWEESPFHDVVHDILIARWTKSYTPLHCMAHSVNPKYYTSSWIEEVSGRVSLHNDTEITENRNKFFKKFFTNPDDMRRVKQQFADFSLCMNAFEDPEAIEDRAHFDPKQWWGTYGAHTPELRDIALKLLGQPASSSCCERNWVSAWITVICPPSRRCQSLKGCLRSVRSRCCLAEGMETSSSPRTWMTCFLNGQTTWMSPSPR